MLVGGCITLIVSHAVYAEDNWTPGTVCMIIKQAFMYKLIFYSTLKNRLISVYRIQIISRVAKTNWKLWGKAQEALFYFYYEYVSDNAQRKYTFYLHGKKG